MSADLWPESVGARDRRALDGAAIQVGMRDQRASFAVGILDPECLGRGIGTEAMRLALRFAFDQLKLHRLSVRVLAYNHRAIRAYQKCGFVIDGHERESAWVNGRWHDDVIMGLLDREFCPQRKIDTRPPPPASPQQGYHTAWANSGLMHRSKWKLFDHLVGAPDALAPQVLC